MGERSWLADIFEEADRERWCVDPRCTTCGASDFRAAYLNEAVRRAGLEPPIDVIRPRQIIAEIPQGHRPRVYDQIVIGLSLLDESSLQMRAARLVIADNEHPLFVWGIAETLTDRLSGTPAGTMLERLRTARASAGAWRVARQAERVADDEQQKKEKEEARLRTLETRAAAKARHDAKRSTLIELLSGMNPMERLAWLADQAPGYRLEMIPRELIPKDVAPDSLSPEQARALINLIDNRGGWWGRFARKITEV